MFADLLKAVQSGRLWQGHLRRNYLWHSVCVMLVLMVAGCTAPQTTKPADSETQAVNQDANSQNASECFGLQSMAKSASDPEISMISEAQQHFEEGMERLPYAGVNPLFQALIAPAPTPGTSPDLMPGENPAQEAYDSFSKAIALDGNFAAAYVKRAIVSYSLKKDPQDILADLEMAVKLRPDYAEAWMERYYILLEVGTIADAVASLNCVIAIEPEHPLALWHRGNYYKMNMEWEKALTDLSTSIAHMPDNTGEAPLAYFDRGVTYLNLKQWENAISDFTKVLEFNDLPEAWLNRAIAYEGAGNVEAAVADYNYALELNLSYIANIQKRLPELKELLSTVEEGSAAYTGLHDLIAKVEQTESEAQRYFEEGMKNLADWQTSNDPWGPDYRVFAAKSFSDAIALNPGVAEYYYQRAQANMLRGVETESVLADLEKTIDLSETGHAGAHYYRAVIMFNLGDEESGWFDLNRSIELDPLYFEPLFLRARLYMRKGEKDTAFPDIMQAIENMPEDVDPSLAYELYAYRAPVYYAQENWQGTVSDNTKLIEIYPQAENYFQRGMAYLELGNAEGFIADMNTALSMNQAYVTSLQEKLPKLQELLARLTPGTEAYRQLDELINKGTPDSAFARCAGWEAETLAMQAFVDALYQVRSTPEWNADTLYIYETAVDFLILGAVCKPENTAPDTFSYLSTEFRKGLEQLTPGTDEYARLEDLIAKLDEADSKLKAKTSEQQPQLIGQ